MRWSQQIALLSEWSDALTEIPFQFIVFYFGNRISVTVSDSNCQKSKRSVSAWSQCSVWAVNKVSGRSVLNFNVVSERSYTFNCIGGRGGGISSPLVLRQLFYNWLRKVLVMIRYDIGLFFEKKSYFNHFWSDFSPLHPQTKRYLSNRHHPQSTLNVRNH